MFRKLMLAGAAATMTVAGIVPATPAMAQGYYERDGRFARDGYHQRVDRFDRYDRYDRRDRRHDRRRLRERCDDGDAGTVIGAIAGGLVGNSVAGRGDRAGATIIGGVLGALAGRAIDRADRPEYCRR